MRFLFQKRVDQLLVLPTGLARARFPGTEGFRVDVQFLGAFLTSQLEFQTTGFELLTEG
jgi:hypothetical protein